MFVAYLNPDGFLLDQLESEGHGQMITWLQELLLEVCFVKLSLKSNLSAVKEPISHIYTSKSLKHLSIFCGGGVQNMFLNKVFTVS